MSRDGGLPERKDPSNLLYDVIPPDLKALELKRVDVELKRKSPSRDQDMFPQELQWLERLILVSRRTTHWPNQDMETSG
jgi:hypothetical protein